MIISIRISGEEKAISSDESKVVSFFVSKNKIKIKAFKHPFTITSYEFILYIRPAGKN